MLILFAIIMPTTRINSLYSIKEKNLLADYWYCPLTPETKRSINSKPLKKMKTVGLIINTSRGVVVDIR